MRWRLATGEGISNQPAHRALVECGHDVLVHGGGLHACSHNLHCSRRPMATVIRHSALLTAHGSHNTATANARPPHRPPPCAFGSPFPQYRLSRRSTDHVEGRQSVASQTVPSVAMLRQLSLSKRRFLARPHSCGERQLVFDVVAVKSRRNNLVSEEQIL